MPNPKHYPEPIQKNKADPNAGQRGMKVVFVPWDYVEGMEFATKTDQWNHATGNRYGVVHWNNGIRNPLLGQVSADPSGVVYLRGHGTPGADYIQVKVDNAGATAERKLSIFDACDRLIRSGLLPTFTGAIKFYHCYSGTVKSGKTYDNYVKLIQSQNKMLREQYKDIGLTKKSMKQQLRVVLPNISIARHGADYMRRKGFKSCVFYGYLGPLHSEYDDALNPGGSFHKAAVLDDLKHRPAHLSGVNLTRASAARIQV